VAAVATKTTLSAIVADNRTDPKTGYARRTAERARKQRDDVQEMREYTTRLELTRRLRAELHDATAGAAALAALADGDEHALSPTERVERMRLEAQRLDLQLRARRELRTAAYSAGKLADTAADGSSAVSERAREQLTDRRRRATAMLELAGRHGLDLAILDLDRGDRQALDLPAPPAAAGEPPAAGGDSETEHNAAEHARSRLARRAARAAGALELGDRFGLDLALSELDPADRAAVKLPTA
jgi:hypothetical protein